MKVEHKHQLVTLAGLAANGGFQSIEASGIVNKAAKAFANDGAPVTDVMRERADKARAQMQVRTFHRMFHRMFHQMFHRMLRAGQIMRVVRCPARRSAVLIRQKLSNLVSKHMSSTCLNTGTLLSTAFTGSLSSSPRHMLCSRSTQRLAVPKNIL